MTQHTPPTPLDLSVIAQQLNQYKALETDIIQPVNHDDIHSGKDYRGIYGDPAAILEQLSGQIPLGHYGYGASVPIPINERDVRRYRFLISQPIEDFLTGHIRLVGPTRAGKSEFLFKLVVNLAINHGFSIVWFSTKWQDDQSFFNAIFPGHTVISANDIPLTRVTKGRFNPLARIPICDGRVHPNDCRKLADTLLALVPINDISGDTEKFLKDAVVRLAALLELLKYVYQDQALLEHVLELWVVLEQGNSNPHPIEELLTSSKIPAEAKQRLRKNLLPLIRRQPAHEAMIGPTAQQLISQIEMLRSVIAANDLPNFADRLRNSEQAQVLVIDQSDGMNSTVSQGLAKMLFPFLYEDLVAQCPTDWKQRGMRPVLMVVDEMNSLLAGKGEFTDFLEKSLAKGVVLAFGQQSSGHNPDPRINAAMSNNTRLQVAFAGCEPTDPAVEEMSAVAGNFPAPFEPHRIEEGFSNLPRLPVDAIVGLGPYASLSRVKSTRAVDWILWVSQENPLIPYRDTLLQLREQLAQAYTLDQGDDYHIRLYQQTQDLLLRSYGYRSLQDLQVGYASLNLKAIQQAYQDTIGDIARAARDIRQTMKLEHSQPEFIRTEMVSLSKTLNDWKHQQAVSVESWLWSSFLQRVVPELQWFHGRWFWQDPPIKEPRIGFWRWSPQDKKRFLFWTWGNNFPTRVASYWQEILLEYKRYAEAFGQENPTVWINGVSTMVNWRIGQAKSITPEAHSQLRGLSRWLSNKE